MSVTSRGRGQQFDRRCRADVDMCHCGYTIHQVDDVFRLPQRRVPLAYAYMCKYIDKKDIALPSFASRYIHIYIYVPVCMCVCMIVHIYIHILYLHIYIYTHYKPLTIRSSKVTEKTSFIRTFWSNTYNHKPLETLQGFGPQ